MENKKKKQIYMIILIPLLLKQSDIKLLKTNFCYLHTEAASSGLKENAKLHK